MAARRTAEEQANGEVPPVDESVKAEEALAEAIPMIEKAQQKIADLKADAKTKLDGKTEPFKAKIKAEKTKATKAGVDRAVLNKILQKRKLRREFESTEGALSDEQRERFDYHWNQLGQYDMGFEQPPAAA